MRDVVRENLHTTQGMCTVEGGPRIGRVSPSHLTHLHTSHTLTFHTDGFGELKFVSNDVYRGYWKDGVRSGGVSIPSHIIHPHSSHTLTGQDPVCQW